MEASTNLSEMNRRKTAATTWVAGCLLVLMGAAHSGEIAVRKEVWIADSRIYGGPSNQLFRPFPKEADEARVEADVAYLRNGDKLCGSIESMADGVLRLRSEFLPEVVRIPQKNVRRLLFKERESQPAEWEWEAKAIFVNGDSLSIGVKGYDGEQVLAAARFSDEVRIPKADLAGIVFHRGPRLLHKADFESEDTGGFKLTEGEWDVVNGILGRPSDTSERPSNPESEASLRLPQQGHLKYSWTVSAESGRIGCARFFFFAQTPDHNAPGNSYEVRLSGSTIYLYVTIQNNMQHVARVGVESRKRSARMEVDYDSESGTVHLKVDGEEVLAGVFSSPINRGDYVLLAAQGRDRFDDIIVQQIADMVLPSANEQAEHKDCVLLTNGDRLSGEIAVVAEEKLHLETGYSGEELGVPLEDVSAVRFARAEREDRERLPAITFRNGDRLCGEVIRLEKGSLLLRSPYLGDVEMDAAMVASVDFPGEDDLPVWRNETEAAEHVLVGPDSNAAPVWVH